MRLVRTSYLTSFEVLSPWLNKEVDWRRSRKEHPWGDSRLQRHES